MANAILNFHFDYLNTSLSDNKEDSDGDDDGDVKQEVMQKDGQSESERELDEGGGTTYQSGQSSRGSFFAAAFLTAVREGSGYQIGWIFGKIPNGLRPLSFSEIMLQFFMTDMVAHLPAGMMAR